MTGRLWPFPDRDGETGPVTRLLREGILIPDLMVAFGVNVAGVIARRGYPMWGQRGDPAFLAWVGASRESKPRRQEAIGQQVRQLRARVIPAAFPSGKPCHFWKGVNGKLKRGGRGQGSGITENRPQQPTWETWAFPQAGRRIERCRGRLIHNTGDLRPASLPRCRDAGYPGQRARNRFGNGRVRAPSVEAPSEVNERCCPADARRLKVNQSPSPRGVTLGCHRN